VTEHLRGLLRFAVGVGHARPLQRVIGLFKAAVGRRISSGVWQRNYWERVVRTEKELNSIREYIDGNPGRWAFDRENPAAMAASGGRRGRACPTPTKGDGSRFDNFFLA
jgi:hypothetical protein